MVQEKAAYQATFQISSVPPSADIEIDGAFVGETPSTISVAAGEHDITISKSGYQSWARKVRTSSGTVVIDRELKRGAVLTTDRSSATQVVMSEPLPQTQTKSAEQWPIGASSDQSPQVRHDGVTLSRVVAGGPADQAGMMVGDVVLALNNHYVYTGAELSNEIQHHPAGSRIPVRYRRRSTIYETYITIGNTESGGN